MIETNQRAGGFCCVLQKVRPFVRRVGGRRRNEEEIFFGFCGWSIGASLAKRRRAFFAISGITKTPSIQRAVASISSIQSNLSTETMSSLFGQSSAAAAASAANSSALGDLSKDIALTSPPEDSISDISFSPQSDHLAVASWDKKVRIYEIQSNGSSEGKALFEHELPVLSCHWSKVRHHLRVCL